MVELYQKYGPMVFRRCHKLLASEELAKEAMQDTFVQYILKEYNAKYPSSLLYRIATNICLNIIRAKKEDLLENIDEALIDIACLEEEFQRRNLLEVIFQKEKISTREIATMLFIDEMTLEETAKEVGLSISGIRKRMDGLKSRVRKEYQQ